MVNRLKKSGGLNNPMFNVLDTRREVKVLDSGTSEDHFFCFVQTEDELFKDSPVSDVISISILTSICSATNSVVSSAYLKMTLLSETADRSLFMTIYNMGPIADP